MICKDNAALIYVIVQQKRVSFPPNLTTLVINKSVESRNETHLSPPFISFEASVQNELYEFMKCGKCRHIDCVSGGIIRSEGVP